MRTSRRPSTLAAGLGLLLSTSLSQAHGAVYSYVKLADTDDGFTSFDVPSLLSNGRATWKATDTEGKDGIYAGDGTFLDTVVKVGEGIEVIGQPSGVSNDIVYPAGGEAERQDLYFFQLGDPSPQLLTPVGDGILDPKTNKFGSVAYHAFRGPVAWVRRWHPLGGQSTLASTWQSLLYPGYLSLAIVGAAAIDDLDCVAVASSRDFTQAIPFDTQTSVARICTPPYQSLSIAEGDPANPSPFASVGSVSAAGTSGAVVFASDAAPDPLSYDGALWLGFLGSRRLIATDDGAYERLGPPSHNAVGVTAFRATLDGGGDGIYIGPDPVTDRVIEAGDGLFGKGVVEVRIGERALGKLGSIAFWAKLEDDSEGVFRADPVAFPPEGVWERIELPSTEDNMTLDASGSTADPEEPIVEYAWDLDFDGTFDVVTPASVTEVSPALYLTLLQPGENPVLLRVTTAAGAYSTWPDVIALPTACSNGVDDDGDGKIDAGEDAGCRDPYKDLSEEPDCSDGLDNDGDGFTDRIGEDPGCRTPESPIENPQCNNGYDDDGDLLVDLEEGFGDPDCLTPWQNFERAEQLPALSAHGVVGLALGLVLAAGIARRRRTPKAVS